jgi:hypothetical protein
MKLRRLYDKGVLPLGAAASAAHADVDVDETETEFVKKRRYPDYVSWSSWTESEDSTGNLG